jgi:hypothetical protein
VSRGFRWLIEFRWPVARVLIWVVGTVLVAVTRGWIAGAIVFVVVGAPILMWGALLVAVRRRDRRREPGETAAGS